jgi:hypothetical protein
MVRQDVCLVLAVVGLLGAAGCSSEPEVPITPQPDAGYVAPPPPPPAIVDAGPTCTPAPCDAAMHLGMQEAIKAREKAEMTFGMKAESTFSCQTVCEAGAVSVPVTLQPGYCYTFLGSSFPNVSQLDLFLKPNLGPNPNPLFASILGAALAQSAENGPNASIGSGKTCYKWPFPIPGPGLIEAKARAGAGPIAVQVYSKRQP